jgi:hypothetical protein
MKHYWYIVVDRLDMHGIDLEPYIIGPYPNCADAGDDAREGLPAVIADLSMDLFIFDSVWVTTRPPSGFRIPRSLLAAA